SSRRRHTRFSRDWSSDVCSSRSIYDWNVHDVWRYIHDERLRYSKIYDYQFRKGYHVNEMRVSSLIHERAFRSICDLPEFEPKTRSEERRVGKEWRRRGAAEHEAR